MLRDATNFGILAALLSASAQAAVLPNTPTTTTTILKRAIEAYSANATIHESCNANQTQSTMLNQGYAEAMQLASFSKQCMC